jgi:hypothetical protein
MRVLAGYNKSRRDSWQSDGPPNKSPAYCGKPTASGPAIYRFATNQGQLVIQTDDADVEVTVKHKGELVQIVDARTRRVVSVNLRAGVYQVELTKDKAGLKLSTIQFTLERNGGQIVRAWFEPGPAPPAGRCAGILTLRGAGGRWDE